MGRFINPFTDVGFKRIFGQEINKDLLIDFLNSLLVGERHIEDITFLDKEVLPEMLERRGVMVPDDMAHMGPCGVALQLQQMVKALVV